MKLKASMLIVLSTFGMSSYSHSQNHSETITQTPTAEQAPITQLPELSLTAVSVEELPTVTTIN